MSSRQTNTLRLRITATAESIVRSGHPWIFANAVREQSREGEAGELAVVYDRKNTFLAIGLYDPESPIRLRVLHVGKPATIDARWWGGRLESALGRRSGLFADSTTGYRWINGESDGWPGFVLDRYGDTLVLKIYTVAWLPRLQEMITLITARLNPGALVLRLSRNIQLSGKRKFGVEDGQLLAGSMTGESELFLENGLTFSAEVRRGQKTGFFLDQRENRERVGALASGRSVLNAFSFSGGFSLYAARGGARAVTDLDISEHALRAARNNFELNQGIAAVQECRYEGIKTDAFAWLEGNTSRTFDIVVLDPPSLAKRESERTRALGAYATLSANGLRAVRAGGVLVAGSCSAHVSAAEFFEAVRGSARRAGRAFEELETTLHPADHPATFPEAEYLKCIYLRLLPKRRH